MRMIVEIYIPLTANMVDTLFVQLFSKSADRSNVCTFKHLYS